MTDYRIDELANALQEQSGSAATWRVRYLTEREIYEVLLEVKIGDRLATATAYLPDELVYGDAIKTAVEYVHRLLSEEVAHLILTSGGPGRLEELRDGT